jgi:hypothetical protein
VGHGRLDRNRIEHFVSGIHAVAAAFFPTNSVTVQLSDQAIYDSTTGSSEADYIIGSNGTVRDQTGAILEAWLSLGASSSYQARATQVSGLTVTGTLGTWLSCSTNLQWGILNTRADSTKSAVLTVEIRDAALPNTVRASATITLTAESSSLN